MKKEKEKEIQNLVFLATYHIWRKTDKDCYKITLNACGL